MKKEVNPPREVTNLPIAYDGCTCMCHTQPGVMHCVHCCGSLREAVYGHKIIRPKLGATITIEDPKIHIPKDPSETNDGLIPFRAIKGLIYGFYGPTPWMVWIRVKGLSCGLEITKYRHPRWKRPGWLFSSTLAIRVLRSNR